MSFDLSAVQPPRAVAALIAAAACWGVGTVVTKHVVQAVVPLTVLPLQLGASCLFLLFVMLARRERVAWSSQMTRLALLGILNPGLAYALGLLGLASITASLSVLLWAAEPVLIVALAAVVLREHVPAALSSTLVVAIVGVVLVVYQPGAVGSEVGTALTLAAVGCCALYTVLTRRLLVHDSSLVVVLVQQLVALVFAAALATAVSAAGGAGWESTSLDPAGWAAAAGSGVLYYGLAFVFYLAGLRHVRASYASAFLPLIPVFGVAAGYLEGERLNGRQWLGACIVIAATLVIAWQQRVPRTAPAPPIGGNN